MEHHHHAEEKYSYKPLIILTLFCLILSFTHENIMTGFMAYFFIFLSLFKFFDLKGFVDGFVTYDLIAGRIRGYAYVYPFIEFGLGVCYLTHFQLQIMHYLTLCVMILSGLGVLNSMRSKKKVKCVCMGTVLNVPLTSVSFVENAGMGVMALYMILGG